MDGSGTVEEDQSRHVCAHVDRDLTEQGAKAGRQVVHRARKLVQAIHQVELLVSLLELARKAVQLVIEVVLVLDASRQTSEGLRGHGG